MKGKALLCLALVTSMLLGVSMISPLSAPSTTIGVEPQSIVDPGLGPGSTFKVEIWVRQVSDLAGLEFHLEYDTIVLTATLIEYGGIYGTGQFDLVNEIHDADGYLWYGVMAGFGKPSFNGDGKAAIITFSVDSVGESDLHLYDTKLGDSALPPGAIVHDVLDGYFSNTQLTTIGVEPQSIVDLGLGPGSTFTVEIWIRNVEDLRGLEFKLGYDTSVLTANWIEYGGIFGDTYFWLMNQTYDAEGYLFYANMEWFGEPSFYGDGRAAIIHFTVDSVGESVLNLYDTLLGDSSVPPMPIVHDVLGGYFRNALISVTLARHSAWPEHHHYSIGKDEDSSNDLFAIVSNDGEMDTWVKVVFTVTDSATNPVGNFEADSILLPAGAMYGYKEDARYKAAFVPPGVGKYYVSAQGWADTNGDTLPDTPMGKVTTFSFNVVP